MHTYTLLYNCILYIHIITHILYIMYIITIFRILSRAWPMRLCLLQTLMSVVQQLFWVLSLFSELWGPCSQVGARNVYVILEIHLTKQVQCFYTDNYTYWQNNLKIIQISSWARGSVLSRCQFSESNLQSMKSKKIPVEVCFFFGGNYQANSNIYTEILLYTKQANCLFAILLKICICLRIDIQISGSET